MIVFGHLAGLPVEEMLPLAPAAGTFLLALRARFSRRALVPGPDGDRR